MVPDTTPKNLAYKFFSSILLKIFVIDDLISLFSPLDDCFKFHKKLVWPD